MVSTNTVDCPAHAPFPRMLMPLRLLRTDQPPLRAWRSLLLLPLSSLLVLSCAGDCSGVPEAPEAEPAAREAAPETTPAIRVEGEVVFTVEEMEETLQALVERHEAADPDNPRDAAWRNLRRQQIARDALAAALLRRAVMEAEVEIEDAEVDAQIARSLGPLHSNEAAFARYLDARGTTATEYHDSIRRELVETRVLSRFGPLEPGEAEVIAFHEEFRERWHAPERVLVESAALRVLPGAPPAERAAAEARVAETREAVIAGELTMAEARAQLAPERADRGEARWLLRGEALAHLDVAASSALFALEAGSVSPLLEGSTALLFVHVIEKRPEGIRALDEVEDAVRRPLEQRLRRNAIRSLVSHMRDTHEVELLEENWPLDAD